MIPFFTILAALIFALIPTPLHARDVESSERLSLLKRATGQSSESSSNFQNRLDAIFDQTAEPERTYVAKEDAAAQQAMIQAENAELLGTLEDEKKPGTEEDQNPFGKKDKTLEKTKDKEIIDASEDAYQESMNKMWEEEDKRREQEKLEKESEEEKQEEESSDSSGLAPSLANNPFYTSPDAPASERNFEENKPIIVSRLMQTTGMAGEDAEALAAESSSEEELIMKLMQEHDFTYMDAYEAAHVENN